MQLSDSAHEALELITQDVGTANLASQDGFIKNSMQRQRSFIGPVNSVLTLSPDLHEPLDLTRWHQEKRLGHRASIVFGLKQPGHKNCAETADR